MSCVQRRATKSKCIRKLKLRRRKYNNTQPQVLIPLGPKHFLVRLFRRKYKTKCNSQNIRQLISKTVRQKYAATCTHNRDVPHDTDRQCEH